MKPNINNEFDYALSPKNCPNIWKECPDLPGILVSKYGDFWNSERNIPLSGNLMVNRVAQTIICSKNGRKMAHIEFAKAWVPNPEGKKYPIPIDDNWTNLTVENWYWSSIRYSSGYFEYQIRNILRYIITHRNPTEMKTLSENININEWLYHRVLLAIDHMEERLIEPTVDEFLSGMQTLKYNYKGEVCVNPLYEINQYGFIRNRETRAYIVGSIMNIGYINTQVLHQGKSIYIYIHNAVANTFIPNPYGLSEVNHINLTKHDPCVWNLEWVTHRGNMEHAALNDAMPYQKDHHWCAINEDQAKEICALLTEGKKYSINKISEITGISVATIYAIRDGKTWCRLASRPEYDIRYYDFDRNGNCIGENKAKTRIIKSRLAKYRQ